MLKMGLLTFTFGIIFIMFSNFSMLDFGAGHIQIEHPIYQSVFKSTKLDLNLVVALLISVGLAFAQIKMIHQIDHERNWLYKGVFLIGAIFLTCIGTTSFGFFATQQYDGIAHINLLRGDPVYYENWKAIQSVNSTIENLPSTWITKSIEFTDENMKRAQILKEAHAAKVQQFKELIPWYALYVLGFMIDFIYSCFWFANSRTKQRKKHIITIKDAPVVKTSKLKDWIARDLQSLPGFKKRNPLLEKAA
jgi:hypothetical protein